MFAVLFVDDLKTHFQTHFQESSMMICNLIMGLQHLLMAVVELHNVVNSAIWVEVELGIDAR